MKKNYLRKICWMPLIMAGLLMIAIACTSDVYIADNSGGTSGEKVTEQPAGENSAKSDDVLSAPMNFDWEADDSGLPDAAGVRVTWDPVPQVDGYEYRFYVFWGSSNEIQDQGDTAEAHASVFFQDNENIKVEVRAYKAVNGEKQYSAWSSDVLEADAVAEL